MMNAESVGFWHFVFLRSLNNETAWRRRVLSVVAFQGVRKSPVRGSVGVMAIRWFCRDQGYAFMPIASVLNILRTIKDRGAISRTDLQQVTGLSWGTITNTTRELLNRKLIK